MRSQVEIMGARRLTWALVVAVLALVVAPAAPAPAASGQAALAPQVVAEPFGSEDPGKRRRWLRADSDGDGLTNRAEARRVLTDPRRADSDGDRLADGVEVRLTQTNPRRADSDGDGFDDGAELSAGSDPWNPASVPIPLAPALSLPPAQPPGDEPQAPGPPQPPAEEPGEEPEEELPPPPPPPPPGDYPDACEEDGATEVTSASQVRNAVEGGEDVCVVADLGNVDLGGLGGSPATVSTEGGSMREIDLGGTTDVTISRARFRSITLRGSHRTQLLGNTIGGTPSARVDDQLIFMPETNNDVAVEGNDIGWTIADNSGNTGYGCRCYGTLNRLRFVGNKLHDLAADGFQGVGGSDVLIDRNEIGPVGRNPGSSEHSDNIQITGNGDNLRITNNWIHHQGYYDGGVSVNAGSTYIHGGDTSALLYENNLIEIAQGRTEICGLGTGGTSRSNITIRRNTWVEGGLAFNGFQSFEWDCDSGSGNTITRNIAVDEDGGFADNGYDAAIVSPNLFGKPSLVALDADGNCTSANCNPAGQEPIGYRKPSGVNW